MTDLVHWRRRACGVEETHKPHAYFDGEETYVCQGVSPTESLAFSLQRLDAAMKAAVERAGVSMIEFAERLAKAFGKRP